MKQNTTVLSATALALAICSLLSSGCSTTSPRAAQMLGDSISGFSGKQGVNGWSYGYWDRTADADKTYSQTTDFHLLRQFGPDPTNQLSSHPQFKTGKLWTLQDGVYFTSLWAEGGHPSGTRHTLPRIPVEHWTIRRWVSTVDSSVTISGHAAKLLTCGDGVQVSIIVDGERVLLSAIDDTRGTNYSVSVVVHRGSVVDFAISPGMQSDDDCDVTKFTGTIRVASATK